MKSLRPNPQDDLGFGTQIRQPGYRFLNKDGSFNVRRDWARFGELHLYQRMVLMSWTSFWGLLLLFYLGFNLLAAGCFLLVGTEGIGVNAQLPLLTRFLEAFFFSVQTFTTVGYGSMSPTTLGANSIATLCAFLGLMSFALATGLFFARFSRPTTHFVYSDQMLITPMDAQGFRSLHFRFANRRRSVLMDVEVGVVMTWLCDAGKRQFQRLQLERSQAALLPLNWTVVHYIDAQSPLRAFSAEKLISSDVEFLISIKAFDEDFAQDVRANTSYKWDELQWDARFEPMFSVHEDGSTLLELSKISTVRIERTPTDS